LTSTKANNLSNNSTDFWSSNDYQWCANVMKLKARTYDIFRHENSRTSSSSSRSSSSGMGTEGNTVPQPRKQLSWLKYSGRPLERLAKPT